MRNVLEFRHFRIDCFILTNRIASGTPTPAVSWQVMRKGDRVFTDLSGSDQELVIESVTLNDAGQYRCIAKNTMGEVEKTTGKHYQSRQNNFCTLWDKINKKLVFLVR